MNMNFVYRTLLLAALFGILPHSVFAAALTVTPASIIQGDPVMVQVEGVKDISLIKKATFEGKIVTVFPYLGKPTVMVPIDLDKKPSAYVFSVTLSSGEVLTKDIVVEKRPVVEAPLGIPESLGGNTTASAQKLVTNLVNEKTLVTNLWTNPKKLWTEKFRYPIVNPIITDTYGYSRQTVGYSIAHKGTDFRAKEGTQVYAMNRGVVRLVRTLPSYGKTIVIDHGQGIMTLYLHLSKFKVSEGELVQIGQVIGLSGATGYAEGAHLHLSIKVGNISIDPMVFLSFFK